MPECAVYVVATPIGNLDDLTPRARKTLEGVDLIAAEDTRHAKKLLSALGIVGKKLVSYHDHNEAERAEQLVSEILEHGTSLALITDAGTPCISDPGYRLVRAAKERGIPVHPVPGASALTALASAAGLATNRLLFAGFLPTKQQALATEIRSWRSARAAVVFYESTRRLAKTLHAIAQVYPDARVAVGRELTKLYEEIVTLPIAESLEWVQSHATLKGEASVMVELPPEDALAAGEGGAPVTAADLSDMARAEFARGATLKDLLRKFADAGLSRADLYRLLLQAKEPN